MPLAKKLPGLKKYDVSNGTVVAPAGANGIHLVATLYFESLDAIKAAFDSAEGQATAADLANFADGGADVISSIRKRFEERPKRPRPRGWREALILGAG